MFLRVSICPHVSVCIYLCRTRRMRIILLAKYMTDCDMMLYDAAGTLAPLDSFREDLKVPFPVELENPHVIRYNTAVIYHTTHTIIIIIISIAITVVIIMAAPTDSSCVLETSRYGWAPGPTARAALSSIRLSQRGRATDTR